MTHLHATHVDPHTASRAMFPLSIHPCVQVAMAALDVFEPEPPVDNPLVGRDDVICTPHLGASTMEAQEGVSLEIAEAVVEALKVQAWGESLRMLCSAPCDVTARAGWHLT